MTSIEVHIKELLIFYIETNYNSHLKKENKDKLTDEEIKEYVTKMYHDKREHAISFVKSSLKILLTTDYPGDLSVTTIISNQDDHDLNIHTIIEEIKIKNK
jgi:hypothetical protein